MRKNIVAGNWKMNNDLKATKKLVKQVRKSIKKAELNNTRVIVAPTFVNLATAVKRAKKSKLEVAAQNMHQATNGAFTGEVSAEMLKSVGVKTVILGHSERRAYFGETDALLAEKVDAALASKLEVIFCFGEELADRKSGNHEAIVESQIKNALFHLGADAFKKIVLAYEPVWAIGTGETASPEQAQDMHAFIRKTLADKYGNDVADSVSILYGGSVKPANAKEIFSKPDVDGGLIGGAALNAKDFYAIVSAFLVMSDSIYIGYDFKIEPLQPGTEILIAELGNAGFESFVENDEGLTAYIQKNEWSASILDDIYILSSNEFNISYEFNEIEQTNWNEEWEKNFNPIVVDDLCSVRAPFHEKPDTTYDLIIEPKMSFGTGHHETTHMMIQHILKNDFEGKSVLDMGCGTGVLAILAEKVGAIKLDAIDIDNWCYLNSVENVERNNCKAISVYEGDVAQLEGKNYDIIIANINRNILLQDIKTYAKCLNANGMLFLSGFYKDDIPMIETECNKHMLKLEEILERGQWVSLKFIN